MKYQKLLVKYIILLLIYVFIVRFVEPYGLNLYYSYYSNPSMMPETVNSIQSIFTAITFFIRLIFAILILVDSKDKKSIDWLIALVTFFSAEIGIVLFMLWQFYKEVMDRLKEQEKLKL